MAKKGIELYELLILAVLVIGIAYLFDSVLLIGLVFIVLNVIRLTRAHKQCIAASA